MKDQILQNLNDLRAYALGKKFEFTIYYHEEDSYLMRFANSAISLNTNEHLTRLSITAYDGNKRAGYELVTDLQKLDEMKRGIDVAAEMVVHAQPLKYPPTIPTFTESFIDEGGYDPALAQISNEDKLAFMNAAVEGLETEALKLSGIFSCGANTVAQINTRSEHVQYFKTSDAQVTMVLAHETDKWEVTAEQSAQRMSELDAVSLQRELSFLVNQYQNDEWLQLPLGNYEIVFGPAATADMINFMNWIGFDGGLMKRGYSFSKEDDVDKKVLSEKFTLVDDPENLQTFPFKRDLTGIPRKPCSIYQDGVFRGFVWTQDDADEFGVKASGHTLPHKSLVVAPGKKEIGSLDELVAMPRDKDVLYIPFLHYMNIVNPSKGVVTASSRFGALLLRKNGSVAVPYNVRMTQSLLDVFGDKVAWLSRRTVPYNTSMSYGARNPTAIVVPIFLCVNDLEISHSNSSF